MTALTERPAPAPPAPAAGIALRHPSRGAVLLVVLAAWVGLRLAFRGRWTLSLAPADVTPLHQRINDVNDWIGLHRNTSPLFLYFFNEIRLVIDTLVTAVQHLIAQPALGLPIPVVGWLGVVAIVTWVAWATGGWRVAVLAAAGFVFFGLQGLWQESMDTLALTLSAVAVALLVGIPLGVWAGLSDRFNRLVTPVLDFMQTMPTFVYLAPLTLFFLIGPASATIATLIYALPPAVRLTAHGIRAVPADTFEAAMSLGSTRGQALRKVLLPMARRTIVLGVNQTIMAALAMVTIAALIDAPGLGKTVLKALETLDVGRAFNAGLALVVMAVVLDRVTTAASERETGTTRPSAADDGARRRLLLAGTGLGVLGCVYLSRTYVWAAEFRTEIGLGGRTVDVGIGPTIARVTDAATTWVQTNVSGVTGWFKNTFTEALLNPLQSLLVQSPWWATVAAMVALATIVGGLRAAVTALICLGLIIGTGMWQDSMTTLATTLVATVLVVLLGLVFGVWMGRSLLVDRVVRPVLDAGQVMPPFVYLVPFVALFGASRFTAISAAVVYGAPVATKIIADGVRGVSATTVEAATSAGSSTWQTISKVQLPMARSSVTLATNQGLIYVLAMVVVGGLVGAGALGYDVVAGFSQGQLFGKGLAAGMAIVLLGIMLDRVTQAAARRSGPPSR
jgi:glycine betaine/proline transport system permease protein